MKKRLILLLTGFITFMSSFAQQATSTQRLKFMGKSMDCSMLKMATHLQTKGCKINKNNLEKNFIYMSGTFQGYLGCDFVLREDYNILSFCRIVLPGSYDMSWAELESDYNDIVYRFTQKYGVPRISTSEFEEHPYSDYEKLKFVKDGKCNYYSVFFIEGGSISVHIDSIERIFITYEDSISKNKIKKLEQDEL